MYLSSALSGGGVCVTGSVRLTRRDPPRERIGTVSDAPQYETTSLAARIVVLVANIPRLHVAARGSANLAVGPSNLDRDTTNALDVCAFAIPYLTTLTSRAAFAERSVTANLAAARPGARTAAEFAAHVGLADVALYADARSHGLDRNAHRSHVSLAAQAELVVLAERIADGHERGFLTPSVAMLAESLARAVQCAEHDREAFRDAAVDWGASALVLYAIAATSLARDVALGDS